MGARWRLQNLWRAGEQESGRFQHPAIALDLQADVTRAPFIQFGGQLPAPGRARLSCLDADPLSGVEAAVLVEHDIELDVGQGRIQPATQDRHHPASDAERDHVTKTSPTCRSVKTDAAQLV